MSVFSSHPRPQYGRLFGALLVTAGVIAGSLYFGNVIRAPLTASYLNVLGNDVLEARETVFPQPTPFDDEGTIISILAGGQGVAVRLRGGRGYIQAYAPPEQSVPIVEGLVRIRGALTEISCAYANTLFEERCTPTVLIESIESVSVSPM
jgi:hypothetical protein